MQGASGKSPFSNVEGSSLAAPLFAATLSLPVIFIVALYGIGPGTKGPFDFLNGASFAGHGCRPSAAMYCVSLSHD